MQHTPLRRHSSASPGALEAQFVQFQEDDEPTEKSKLRPLDSKVTKVEADTPDEVPAPAESIAHRTMFGLPLQVLCAAVSLGLNASFCRLQPNLLTLECNILTDYVPPSPLQLVSAIAYCSTSASMVLLNKLVLSSFGFKAPTLLLLFQCIFAVVAVQLAAGSGAITLEGWNPDIARIWFPANVVFVAMLWSSFVALQVRTWEHSALPARNLTNIRSQSKARPFFPIDWPVIPLGNSSRSRIQDTHLHRHCAGAWCGDGDSAEEPDKSVHHPGRHLVLQEALQPERVGDAGADVGVCGLRRGHRHGL
jgi:hypothetical protein